MGKAEQFIREHTRSCSNIIKVNTIYGAIEDKEPWLTPEEARRAVEIAKEEVKEELFEKTNVEAFQYIKERIKHCSNISHHNTQYGSIEFTQPWLTPTEARKAVIIAEDNIIEKAAKWIGTHLLSASCGGEQIESFYKDMKEI